MKQYLKRWDTTVETHADKIEQLERHIERLRQPFGWLAVDALKNHYDEQEDDVWDHREPVTAAEKVAYAESKAGKALDPYAD